MCYHLETANRLLVTIRCFSAAGEQKLREHPWSGIVSRSRRHMWVAFGFGSCPGSGYGSPTHVNGPQSGQRLFPTPFYCSEKCLDSENITE